LLSLYLLVKEKAEEKKRKKVGPLKNKKRGNRRKKTHLICEKIAREKTSKAEKTRKQ